MAIADYLFESAHPGGTYSSLGLSTESSEDIFAYCTKLSVPNLVNPDEYHCTLIYSRKDCHDILDEDFSLPCSAIPIGYKILGNDTKVLVLEIYCPNAVRLHELFMQKYGATHDYDEYIPHITLATDFDGEIPTEIPEIEIKFISRVVEELQ